MGGSWRLSGQETEGEGLTETQSERHILRPLLRMWLVLVVVLVVCVPYLLSVLYLRAALCCSLGARPSPLRSGSLRRPFYTAVVEVTGLQPHPPYSLRRSRHSALSWRFLATRASSVSGALRLAWSLGCCAGEGPVGSAGRRDPHVLGGCSLVLAVAVPVYFLLLVGKVGPRLCHSAAVQWVVPVGSSAGDIVSSKTSTCGGTS